MASLTFVGTGEAFDPDLPNTSVLYAGSRTILVDCGYSIPHAFWRVTRDPNLVDAVYISHQHADHAFGLPALLLWMQETGRQRPLEVIGGPNVASWLGELLELAYPGSYPPGRCYPIRPVALSPGAVHSLGAVAFRVAQSRHGVRNLSVRIEDDGVSVCYSGDGAPTDATRALFEGANVLIHECYTPAGGKNGHARLDELLVMAERAKVGTLCILHFGRDQKVEIVEQAGKHVGGVRVLIPRPGDTLALPAT